jgi:cell division initiation protein
MDGKPTQPGHDNREYQGIAMTSVDVLQQKFRIKFRGYDVQDVDSFLELVAREMERMSADVLRLRDEAGALRHTIELHKKKEESINAALLTVQRLADEVKERASAEAEQHVRQAQQEAEALVVASRQEADGIRSDAQRAADQLLYEARQKDDAIRMDMLQLKDRAGQEARTMIDEARQEVARLRDGYMREQARLQEDISLLKQQKFQFYISIKSLIENHLKLLDGEEQL